MSHDKKLTKQETLHTADLIKIHIPEDEVQNYQNQLSTVLDSLEVFNELDTKDVPITAQVTGLKNIMREDIAQKGLTQDQALSNANSKENGYFVVKRVVKDN